jgi:hypothetical protein
LICDQWFWLPFFDQVVNLLFTRQLRV